MSVAASSRPSVATRITWNIASFCVIKRWQSEGVSDHAIKVYRGRRSITNVLLTSVLDGGESYTSRLCRFTPGEKFRSPIE